MTKIKSKRSEIIKKVKEMKVVKENYTFRLPSDLMDEFIKVCDKEGINRTAVLIEFLKDFTGKNI